MIMKIVKLMAENFKRLVAVEITPNGNAVLLTGKNGAGKSSVLDAPMAALCGKKYCPPKPIRDGEKHAEIVVDMGEYKVTRTFTQNGGGSLKVENADGLVMPSPQAFLDRIVGQIAFDPMSFSKLEPRRQREVLMELLGLDFSDIDEQLQEIKAKRSEVKRAKETTQHEIDRAPLTPNLPEKEISVKELTEKLTEAIKHNSTVEKNIETHKELQENCCELESFAEDIEARIKELTERLESSRAELKETKAEIERIESERQDSIQIEPIQTEINGVEEKNRLIRQNILRKQLQATAEKMGKQFSSLGQTMKNTEAEKAERLAKAKMPVKGLSINEDCVTFDGIPFEQVNAAKRLEVGVAIAMALNPELKVMRMDGNGLDKDSLKTICNMAKAKDYQAWIEQTSDDDKVGIFIEAGEIKNKEQCHDKKRK
jgi:DNA repair exonuclease SbcCD ATPase subunit